MNTSDRYLLNTIDANTRSAGRPRNGSGLGGMFLVLIVTGAAMTAVLMRYLGYV